MKKAIITNLKIFFLFLVCSFIQNISLGQNAPNLGTASSFALFTTNGAFSNTGATTITGDIGTNLGSVMGNPTVIGQIHEVDSVSAKVAADLGVAYSYLSGITCDSTIGTTLGNNQVLTPKVYCLGAASTLNDTLYLNAQGDSSAIFIIKINGALSTGKFSDVILINSASLCNVYWQINGAFTSGDSSVFRGTVVSDGAITLNTGAVLNGRALTTAGAINTTTITATIPSGCTTCFPKITTEPANQEGCIGRSVSFSVAATGTGLTYQWRKGSLNLNNGGHISGATSDTLKINPVSASDASSNYDVIISGSCTPKDTSIQVSLIVNSPPNIITEPTNQTVCAGSPVSFTVAASGTGLTYQWRKGASDLTSGTNISDATSATLTINPVNISDTASDYNVVISGSCVPNDTSINVSLKVNTAPNIGTESTNQVSCAGSSVIFLVAATGTGLTYQWRKGAINLTDGGNISGATSDTLKINPVNISDAATNYNVIITGTCAPKDTSINVSLVVNTAPNITTEPANQAACAGSPVNFSVVATGTVLTYQWRKGSLNLTNGGRISGTTSATLTINPVNISDTASNYNVVISGTCAPKDSSKNVSLTVNTAPGITTEPTNQVACEGNLVNFSVAATGTGLTYQWRKGSANFTNGGSISGATSATLTINPVNISDTASNYNVIISGSCSPEDTSKNVSLTVNTAPNITTEPANQAACAGSPVNFSVVATGTGLTYQWRKGSLNLTNGGRISGTTSATLTINPVNISDTASNYNVIISGSCSPEDTSKNVSLTVNTAPNITTEPTNQAACIGGTANFSVIATGTNLTYQWRKGTVNLSNGGHISGATSATLTINPVNISDTSSNYNVVISGTCSPNDTSIKVFLTVNTAPGIITEPANQTACIGNPANFSVTATGTNLTYQWRKGIVNFTNGGHISGATSATLTINPVTISDTASNYNVVISGICSPKDTSINVSLVVNTAPNIITEPINHIACIGSSVAFSVTAKGTSLTYQWRKGTVNLTNGGPISGATSAILTINPVNISDTSSNYNVVVTGTCTPKDTSINVSLVVNTAPNISTEPTNQAACIGSSANFTVVATGTSLSYQWRKGTVNLANGGHISGVTSDMLTINPVNISDTTSNYNVIITGTCSPYDTSINVSLVINKVPGITTQPFNQVVCAGNKVSFSVTALGSGLTYQWRKGAMNLTNGGHISGATSDTLTINPVKVSFAASDYNVVITGTCAPNDTSINVSLVVDTAPVIITEPTNQTICTGNKVSFSVAAIGTNLTYQWRKGIVNLSNGGHISGVTSDTLTINPVNVTDIASDYNVIITGTCAPNDTSINVSLLADRTPVITTQPTNQTVCDGNSVNFSVFATGTGLTYQWRKGTANLSSGGNISGATSDKLTINPVNISDAASNYNVIITGICSPKDTSINVSLTINAAPVVTMEPTNQEACNGDSVSFSVAATGIGLSYQWRKGSVNLTNGGHISGATSDMLTIYPVNVTDVSSDYNVVISGSCIPKDTSINVTLVINNAPDIITEPTNQAACVGSSVSFSVAAIGTGLTYQWKKGGINLINGGHISGATSDMLIINPVNLSDTASNYNVIITGKCSPISTSINVSLSINPIPALNNVSNQTICNNAASTAIIFSGGGAGTIYNWTNDKPSIGLAVSGSGNISSFMATNPGTSPVKATITVFPIANGCNGISSIFTITVNPTPVAIANSNSPICEGSAIKLSTPTITGATYSWTGPNGFASTSQNPTITSVSITDAGIYSLTVSIIGCTSTPSIITIEVINCSVDLSVVKTVNITNPLIGHNVEFTIIATNNGPSDGTGVKVTDILQSGYTYVSASTETYNLSTGVWIIGNLNNGISESLTITAKVNSIGNHDNTATINGNELDKNLANNVSSITTEPKDFFIPEGFSPNGDGINDVFVIREIANYPDNKFILFNRWGDKVFEASPYQNTWDGRSTRGLRVGENMLPVGTYFYILDLGDGSDVIKGTIYLNR